MYPFSQRGYNMEIEKSFDVNMQINKHNLDVMICELKHLAQFTHFLNPKINETLLCLYYMSKRLDKLSNKYVTRCTLFPVEKNKQFPDLYERYKHLSVYDPLNGNLYNRDIRHLLLNGTNVAELDITATAVYIFAKFISCDSELLQTYKERDFYTVLPNISRDEQKKLVQVWLQGPYKNPDVEFNNEYEVYVALYNKLFPITGEYLKNTAIVKDREYARNSGLFRDREVRLLDKMLSSDVHLINHLHDGYYVNPRNIKKCGKIIKDVWGDDVKYKITDYSKIAMSDDEIRNKLYEIDWTKETDIVDFDNVPNFIIRHKSSHIYDPYFSLTGYMIDKDGECVYDNGSLVEVPKTYVIQKKCMELFNHIKES